MHKLKHVKNFKALIIIVNQSKNEKITYMFFQYFFLYQLVWQELNIAENQHFSSLASGHSANSRHIIITAVTL